MDPSVRRESAGGEQTCGNRGCYPIADAISRRIISFYHVSDCPNRVDHDDGRALYVDNPDHVDIALNFDDLHSTPTASTSNHQWGDGG